MIPPRYRNASFETAKGEIKDLPDSCMLVGPVGCGKTHLVWCKIRELCKGQKIVFTKDRCWDSAYGFTEKNILFTNIPSMLAEIKACFDDQNKDPQREIMSYCNCDYLIIDDLGAEKITDYAREVVYQIIDHRYIHWRPLIITSNLGINEIGKAYDDRIASRISAICKIIKLPAIDYRMQTGT